MLLDDRLRLQHLKKLRALGLRDGLQKLVDVVRAERSLGHGDKALRELKVGSRALCHKHGNEACCAAANEA